MERRRRESIDYDYYDYNLFAGAAISDFSTADIARKDYDGTNNNLRRILQHDKKVVFVDILSRE
jgi:hypothetical protein